MNNQMYAKEHEVYKVTVKGHTTEYIGLFFDRSRIGIRLDGDLKWFNIRHTKQNTVYCTKTGITLCGGESLVLFHWVQKSDDDALWLAQEAHRMTRPTKNPMCADYIAHYPEIA